MEGRNQCFTLNNYTSEDEDLLKSFFNEYCRYMVYGKEIANKFSQDRIVLVYFMSDIDKVKENEDMIDNYKRSIKYRHVIIDDNNKEELIICNMTDLLNQLNIK